MPTRIVTHAYHPNGHQEDKGRRHHRPAIVTASSKRDRMIRRGVEDNTDA
jgi:hypothetical protein